MMWLMRVVFPLTLLFAVQVNAVGLDRWHRLTLGFNLGYPDHARFSEVALEEIARLGIQDVRVYEVFDGRLNIEYQGRLKKALDRILAHGMRPMITISNVPARLLPRKKARVKMISGLPWSVARKVDRILTYSNRFPPSDWASYRTSIQELLTFLFSTYGLDQVRTWIFEIGNEPDAPLYFWGNAEEFRRMYSAAMQVLRENGIRQVGGPGVTNHPIFLDPALERSQIYRDFMIKMAGQLQDGEFLSFHLYERQSMPSHPLSNLPEWLANTPYRVLITEWNVSSQGQKATGIFSKPGMWGASFIRLLADCARYGIDSLYIFKLMDYPPQQTAQLGAFNREGKPKPWFFEFRAIYRVIRHGYRVVESNDSLVIEGVGLQRIVMAVDTPVILSSQVAYSPNIFTGSDERIQPGEWVILSPQHEIGVP